jgi:hypothetical protein
MYHRSIERSRCRYNRGVMYRGRIHWAGPSNSDQLDLLRGGGVEDNRTKTFPSLLSFTGVKVKVEFGERKNRDAKTWR